MSKSQIYGIIFVALLCGGPVYFMDGRYLHNDSDSLYKTGQFDQCCDPPSLVEYTAGIHGDNMVCRDDCSSVDTLHSMLGPVASAIYHDQENESNVNLGQVIRANRMYPNTATLKNRLQWHKSMLMGLLVSCLVYCVLVYCFYD